MNKIYKLIIILTIILFFTYSTKAQDYERTFGIKMGTNPGIFYRKFSDYKNALEIITNFQRGGVQLTLVREYYNPLLLEFTEQFFVFYGIGAEVGYTILSSDIIKFKNKLYRRIQPEAGIGLCANLGLEYHFLNQPISVSLEYIPEFQFYIPYTFYKNNFNFAFSISYTF